jgi:hypothetical protein
VLTLFLPPHPQSSTEQTQLPDNIPSSPRPFTSCLHLILHLNPNLSILPNYKHNLNSKTTTKIQFELLIAFRCALRLITEDGNARFFDGGVEVDMSASSLEKFSFPCQYATSFPIPQPMANAHLQLERIHSVLPRGLRLSFRVLPRKEWGCSS